MASYSLVWNLRKQVQGLAFSGEVWLEHFSTPQGSIQFEGICLLKVLIREAENQGIPSKPCWNWVTAALFIWWLFDQFPDIILCQGLERKQHVFFFHWHPRNRDWFRILAIQFCSDFLNLHHKSPNASARSFNESESGYCSCCNGFVSD